MAPPSRAFTIAVAPRGEGLTEGLVAVASVLAIERVADFAEVLVADASTPLQTVTADPTALGVLEGGVHADVRRAGAATGLSGTALMEDDLGRWFRPDDDGQRRELRDITPWALLGLAASSPRLHTSTEAGHRLAEVFRATHAQGTEAALSWARGAVDAHLAAIAARSPERIRSAWAALQRELEQLRAAHDSLRSRYERDLELVRGSDE